MTGRGCRQRLEECQSLSRSCVVAVCSFNDWLRNLTSTYSTQLNCSFSGNAGIRSASTTGKELALQVADLGLIPGTPKASPEHRQESAQRNSPGVPLPSPRVRTVSPPRRSPGPQVELPDEEVSHHSLHVAEASVKGHGIVCEGFDEATLVLLAKEAQDEGFLTRLDYFVSSIHQDAWGWGRGSGSDHHGHACPPNHPALPEDRYLPAREAPCSATRGTYSPSCVGPTTDHVRLSRAQWVCADTGEVSGEWRGPLGQGRDLARNTAGRYQPCAEPSRPRFPAPKGPLAVLGVSPEHHRVCPPNKTTENKRCTPNLA